MLKVLLDVDGVLADFTGAFVAACQSVLGRPFHITPGSEWDLAKKLNLAKKEEDRVYAEVVGLPGFAYGLKPLPGAARAVAAISQIADVYFCTAPVRSSPTWDFDRRKWLTSVFGKCPASNQPFGTKTIFTRHKELVRGNIFVDDKPDNVVKWAEANELVPVTLSVFFNPDCSYSPLLTDPRIITVSSLEQLVAMVQVNKNAA